MSEESNNHHGGLPPTFNLGQRISDTAPGPDDVLPDAVKSAKKVVEGYQTVVDGLEYAATHDALTGLLNPTAWRGKLEEAIARGGELGVVFIDLTNFKKVNDLSPRKHEDGDAVLKDVASIIDRPSRLVGESAEIVQGSIRSKNEQDTAMHRTVPITESEVAGRLGGDEFGILLDLQARGDEGKAMSLEERVQVVMSRLGSNFEEMISRQPELREQYGFDVAIGGAVWHEGMTSGNLLTKADHNMAQNKQLQHDTNGQYR